MNFLFETESAPSYIISPELQLESKGLGDGYYFVKIAQIVFRCKIHGILDGYVETNLKNPVLLESVSLDEQIDLRREFEVQKSFLVVRSFVESMGFYDSESQTFYGPNDLICSLSTKSISINDLDQDISFRDIDLDFQKRMIYKSELDSLGSKMDEFFNTLTEFYGLLYSFKFYKETKEKIADLFINVCELSKFYPMDDLLKFTKQFLEEVLILFKFPRPKLTSFLEAVNSYRLNVRTLKDSQYNFYNDLKVSVNQLIDLSPYFHVISKFSNFGDRYNFHALLEFFDFLVYFSGLKETNSDLFERLQKFSFEKKFKDYLQKYLSTKRIMTMLCDGQRVVVTNEINLIDQILSHDDVFDFDFTDDLKEQVLGLKMAFNLHK